MTTTTAKAPPEGVYAALACFLLIVTSIAVLGAIFAAGLFGTKPVAEAAPGGPFQVAQDVPTSFGFVAVEHSQTLKGLTPKQLGGAVHGIGSFVGRDKALVQAAITITNTTVAPLQYSPRQFRLVATAPDGKERRYGLAHANIRQGTLQPDAAIDGKLSFVAPRDGSRLAIEFADPGAAKPLQILLGNGSGKLTARERAALAEGHTLQQHDAHEGN